MLNYANLENLNHLAVNGEAAMERLKSFQDRNGPMPNAPLNDVVTLLQFNTAMFDMLVDAIANMQSLATKREEEQEKRFKETRADLEVLFIRDKLERYNERHGKQD